MINYQYGIDGLRTLSQCEGAGWILPVGMNNGVSACELISFCECISVYTSVHNL